MDAHRVHNAIKLSRLPAWRHPGQLPQGGNAARVTGLWRVRGEFFCAGHVTVSRRQVGGCR